MPTEIKVVHISVPVTIILILVSFQIGKWWGQDQVWAEAIRAGAVSMVFDHNWILKWKITDTPAPVMPHDTPIPPHDTVMPIDKPIDTPIDKPVSKPIDKPVPPITLPFQ